MRLLSFPTTVASRSAIAWAITVASSEALVSYSSFSLASCCSCNFAAAFAFFCINFARSFARVSTIFLFAATTAAVVSSRCFCCSATLRGSCVFVPVSLLPPGQFVVFVLRRHRQFPRVLVPILVYPPRWVSRAVRHRLR